jgi:hypothetical protein
VFVQVSTLNAESSHQPLHPFAAHPDALAGQHGVDAWRAVAAARPLPDLLDPLRHHGISHRPHRRDSAGAVVEGGHRFADRGEQRRNPEGVTMRFHKRHDLRRVESASWAKNALANLKISLVRFSSAFSLRSRFSSSASLLVNRSSRSPRSASSWRTHLRNVSAPIPNSRATSAIVRPSEDRYKSIARALNSGANLPGLVTILLLPWPNQTKIRSLQESGGTSLSVAAGVRAGFSRSGQVAVVGGVSVGVVGLLASVLAASDGWSAGVWGSPRAAFRAGHSSVLAASDGRSADLSAAMGPPRSICCHELRQIQLDAYVSNRGEPVKSGCGRRS